VEQNNITIYGSQFAASLNLQIRTKFKIVISIKAKKRREMIIDLIGIFNVVPRIVAIITHYFM
jgi:hypothetical protein